MLAIYRKIVIKPSVSKSLLGSTIMIDAAGKTILEPRGTRLSFRERLKQARPDVAECHRLNERKTGIAMKLRALRDDRNMTQAEVAEAANMTQSSVARMEALKGSVPTIESIERYVAACRGLFEISITTDTDAN
jgi:DNA-binding XRE family transcriptional regulator